MQAQQSLDRSSAVDLASLLDNPWGFMKDVLFIFSFLAYLFI